MADIKQVADAADMIVNGYAFTQFKDLKKSALHVIYLFLLIKLQS